jgi:hypothetical protein
MRTNHNSNTHNINLIKKQTRTIRIKIGNNTRRNTTNQTITKPNTQMRLRKTPKRTQKHNTTHLETPLLLIPLTTPEQRAQRQTLRPLKQRKGTPQAT